MGISISFVGGISVGIDWGAVIAFGIVTAVRTLSSDRGQRYNGQLNYICSSLSGREELCQTIYKSKKSKNEEPSFDTTFKYLTTNEPIKREKEEDTEIIFKGFLNNNKINEFDKSFNPLNQGMNGVNNFNIGNLEHKEFERYIRYKAFPSLNSSSNFTDKNFALRGFTFGKKFIETSTQTHIIDLLTEKTINYHYKLNFKYKKIMDKENFKIFRENNLDNLHLKYEGLKIFKGIMNLYDMGNKIYKINSIITDEEKKNFHKVVEVSLEGGKIATKNYFLKHYFLNTLKNTQKGIKNFKNIYKTSKIVKATKILVKGGSIGTGIVITYIADELIEGTCNLLGRELEKTIDKFEDKK